MEESRRESEERRDVTDAVKEARDCDWNWDWDCEVDILLPGGCVCTVWELEGNLELKRLLR